MFLLFAKPGIGDLTEIIIAVVVVLFAVLRQIFEANKEAGKKAAALGPQPQAAPKQVPPAAGKQADPLRSQVEEFLRRAGQKSQASQQQAQPQRPASEIEVLVDDGSRPPQRRTLVETTRPNDMRRSLAGSSTTPNSDKRPARRSVTPKRRVTLAERAAVREEKRVGNLAEQQPHLGQRIIDDDKQFDEQLKAKFDHKVGTLGGSAIASESQSSAPQRETPAAAQIAAMLANPEGVRQAVILNEILTRPSDRW
jgi:hypothetical protein